MNKIELTLEEIYKLFSEAVNGVQYSDRDRVFRYLGDSLQMHHGVSEEDIRILNHQFAVEDEDGSVKSEKYDEKYRCCSCEDELYFGRGSNCIGMCATCKNEICEAKDCSVKKEENLYCLHCYGLQSEDEKEKALLTKA